MAVTKIFNGKRYTLSGITSSKRDAQQRAKRAKDRGCKARVVKGSVATSFTTGTRGTSWKVFERCAGD